MKKIWGLVFWIILCEGIGLVSLPFTIAAIPGWYAALAKPSFSPPNWVFGPAWTILYFLMGMAMWLIGRSSGKKKEIKTAIILFFLQLGLNFLWSLVFFGLHSPILGLVDIVLLWILIAATIRQFKKVSQAAAYLLIPYFLWVSFASILNLAIVLLNP